MSVGCCRTYHSEEALAKFLDDPQAVPRHLEHRTSVFRCAVGQLHRRELARRQVLLSPLSLHSTTLGNQSLFDTFEIVLAIS